MATIYRATNLIAFNLRYGTTPNKVKSSHYKQIKQSNVRHYPCFKGLKFQVLTIGQPNSEMEKLYRKSGYNAKIRFSVGQIMVHLHAWLFI